MHKADPQASRPFRASRCVRGHYVPPPGRGGPATSSPSRPRTRAGRI
jgi:hypothetical protein